MFNHIKLSLLLLLLFALTLFVHCDDNDPMDDNSGNNSSATAQSSSAVSTGDSRSSAAGSTDDSRIETGTLDDCQFASYTVTLGSINTFTLTVDHSDGLEVYLNGDYLGRVTSTRTFFTSLFQGDIIRLENDGLLCAGSSINYSLTFDNVNSVSSSSSAAVQSSSVSSASSSSSASGNNFVTGTLDDCESVSHTVLSGSFISFTVTVDHSDGLEVYLNGEYLGRVTSTRTFTPFLFQGDIIKLENDALFCLGSSINYTLTFN